MMEAKLIAALIILLGVAGAGVYVMKMRGDLAVARADRDAFERDYKIAVSVANENREALERIRSESLRLDALLAARTKQRNDAARRASEAEQTLETLKHDDDKVRDWAAVPLPDGVRHYLRTGSRGPNGGGEAVPAAATGGGDSGPGPAVQSQ